MLMDSLSFVLYPGHGEDEPEPVNFDAMVADILNPEPPSLIGDVAGKAR